MTTEILPVIICTSVIRSAAQGESHGGMYLVDLNTGSYKQVVDWNDQSIDWQGRGADRGLRGLAFYRDMILAAASDEVFFYNQDFSIVKSYRSPYLKHCHEIFVEGDRLYLSSTGFDSVLVFNLLTEKFERGYCYRDQQQKEASGPLQKILSKLQSEKISFYDFDPNCREGPEPGDSTHINNVFVAQGSIYFSGTRMNRLMRIEGAGKATVATGIPKGTHNVQFHKGYVLMNNTGKDSVIKMSMEGKILTEFPVVRYPAGELTHTNLSEDHARQAFGRGLCTQGDHIIAGSSPATISVYHDGDPKILRSVNLTKDIRNAVHGLEIYPYASAKELLQRAS